MTAQISYKNKKTKNNAQNIVLFVDEKFNVSSLKKHISGSDYAFIADLIKSSINSFSDLVKYFFKPDKLYFSSTKNIRFPFLALDKLFL